MDTQISSKEGAWDLFMPRPQFLMAAHTYDSSVTIALVVKGPATHSMQKVPVSSQNIN